MQVLERADPTLQQPLEFENRTSYENMELERTGGTREEKAGTTKENPRIIQVSFPFYLCDSNIASPICPLQLQAFRFFSSLIHLLLNFFMNISPLVAISAPDMRRC